MAGRVGTWRNGIATAAEDAVAKMINRDEYLDSREKISAFIIYLLGDENTKVPFYFQTWGDGKHKSVRHPAIYRW